MANAPEQKTKTILQGIMTSNDQEKTKDFMEQLQSTYQNNESLQKTAASATASTLEVASKMEKSAASLTSSVLEMNQQLPVTMIQEALAGHVVTSFNKEKLEKLIREVTSLITTELALNSELKNAEKQRLLRKKMEEHGVQTRRLK